MKVTALCGMVLWGSIASAVSDDCRKLFDIFNVTTTYEEAGKVAEKMYEGRCWPALQGENAEETTATPQLLPITDCASLSKHIIQMSVDQATVEGPAILRLYEINFLTQGTWDKVIHSRLKQGYRWEDASPFNKTPEGTERVLNCTAKARFTKGPTELIQMYLDRDQDGQEFIGMVGLLVL